MFLHDKGKVQKWEIIIALVIIRKLVKNWQWRNQRRLDQSSNLTAKITCKDFRSGKSGIQNNLYAKVGQKEVGKIRVAIHRPRRSQMGETGLMGGTKENLQGREGGDTHVPSR